jgi:hypothetical protein
MVKSFTALFEDRKMGSLVINSSNVKELDNYVLYRVWNEATTKRERSLAMKEIKRRQKMGNMADGGKSKPFVVKVEESKWTNGIGWRKEKRHYGPLASKDHAKQLVDQMKKINKERAHEIPEGKGKWFNNIKVEQYK